MCQKILMRVGFVAITLTLSSCATNSNGSEDTRDPLFRQQDSASQTGASNAQSKSDSDGIVS